LPERQINGLSSA